MNQIAVPTDNEELVVTTAGMLFNPSLMDSIERFAELMTSGASTVPSHLSSKGDCMAVILQAAQWGMNPFAVAQKTHMVNGVLGYEAQLVNAVITSRAPITGRIKYEWFGNWDQILGKFKSGRDNKQRVVHTAGWEPQDEQGLGVKVWATFADDDEPTELSLMLVQAQVRNSPLWVSDPKQQLAYLAVKRWSRLHCPEVILGVYSSDELEDTSGGTRAPERVINPDQASPSRPSSSLKSQLGDSATIDAKVVQTAAIDHSAAINTLIESCLSCKALADLEQCGGDIGEFGQQYPDADLSAVRHHYRERLAQLKPAKQQQPDFGNE